MEILKRAGGVTVNDLRGANQNKEKFDTGLNLSKVIENASNGVKTIFEKEKEDYSIYMEEFEKFLNSDIINNDELVIEGNVIIKLFFVSKFKSSSIILEDVVSEGIYKTFPIGKVINKGNSKILNNGDFIQIPLMYTKTVVSKDYIDYKQKVAEQPSLAREFPAPPMYIGKLNDWTQYMYQENIFSETTAEDQHTFCIPERFIQSKISKEKAFSLLRKEENNEKDENS